ncbi:PKD domain-containing protein [Lacinutrix venerupis]|uniref:PKD domain-containing protein n=1 Tax=Lacinutrix venerupis TaxID=1486034 RepID=A0AAC9LQ80_9FLAO|nr:PKD domain-containing protein [Lacinutrix venerupis]APY00962.1 hypothetical protein BWR22_11805 [Lacinutrix venerupis]
MKNKINIFRKTTLLLLSVVATSFLLSCEDAFRDDLPDSNSQLDTKFPEANFSYSADDENDFTVISFQDLSSESNGYLWDFGVGDPSSSTLQDPVVTFPGEGTYPVTLTTNDSNGVTSSITIDVEIVEPEIPDANIPTIAEPGFDQGNDSRDAWRNPDLGGVIQITSSGGYFEGSNAAKLPDPGSDRIGYQLLTDFTPNTDYVLTFKYRMKDDQDGLGVLNVHMLTETNDPADIAANTIESVSYTESATNTSELQNGILLFNSGANTSLAIYFDNLVDEAYIDSFELDLQ